MNLAAAITATVMAAATSIVARAVTTGIIATDHFKVMAAEPGSPPSRTHEKNQGDAFGVLFLREGARSFQDSAGILALRLVRVSQATGQQKLFHSQSRRQKAHYILKVLSIFDRK
jgi:hypothetical protein